MGGKFWKKLGKGLASPFVVIGSAAATAGVAVAAGATLGQCNAVNKALKKSAKTTGKVFMKSDIRHIGQAVGHLGAAAGCAVASGATLGQCKGVNEVCVIRTESMTAVSADGRRITIETESENCV